jgi:hypothetical protein
MRSSDRRIAAARKIEPEAHRANDTLPAPPPSSGALAEDGDDRDTIPTPPPESGTTDVIVVPPLRGVTIADADEAEGADGADRRSGA